MRHGLCLWVLACLLACTEEAADAGADGGSDGALEASSRDGQQAQDGGHEADGGPADATAASPCSVLADGGCSPTADGTPCCPQVGARYDRERQCGLDEWASRTSGCSPDPHGPAAGVCGSGTAVGCYLLPESPDAGVDGGAVVWVSSRVWYEAYLEEVGGTECDQHLYTEASEHVWTRCE